MPKRLAALALWLVAGSMAARAQQWTGAVKIGGAYSSFSGALASGDADWEPLAGLAAGAAVGFDFGTGLAVVLDMTYVRKGAASDITFQGAPARIQSDLTYLELPVMLNYRPHTGGPLAPRFFAGPVFAVQLDAHLTHSAGTGGILIREVDGSIHGRDYGVMAGAAAEIEMAGQRFFLEARYYRGFADITKPHPVRGDSEIVNRSVTLMTGVAF